MDYIDLVTQHCPPAIVQSITSVDQPMDKTTEMLLFSEITPVKLNPHCAYSVVGQFAQKLSPKRSSMFKSTFFFLARRHHKNLREGLTNGAYQYIREEISAGLMRIINEIEEGGSQRGSMLGIMAAYRINLLEDIRTRVDYTSLTGTFLRDWQFNEYAACMGEEGASERMATLLTRGDAPRLRMLFTQMAASLSRGDAYLPRGVIRTLVEPYLNDSRVTHDVDGDGPPVSHYARKVETAL